MNLISHRSQAIKVNSEVLWTSSHQLNESLNDYALGLAVRVFDQSIKYYSVRVGPNRWYVMFKGVGYLKDRDSTLPQLYDRVRIVDVDMEGYMSCSCGYVQRMLMPCRHICAVIKKQEYYVPSLFHVRWHKLFGYYHNNVFKRDICEKTKSALHQLLLSTRSNAYLISGKYKGIYIKESQFLKSLEPYVKVENDVSKVMDYILDMTMKSGPVVASSFDISEILKQNCVGKDDTNYSQPQLLEVYDQENETSFGGASDMCITLSQTHADYEEIVEDQLNSITMNFYKEGLPAYEEMIRTCPNRKAFDECMEMMRTRHTFHVCSKGIQRGYGDKKASGLFGEDITSKRNIKRHKTYAETVITQSKRS